NNPSVSNEQLESYRQALIKMLNSLTWKRVIVRPIAIDPDKTIFRIDLRQLGWSLEKWNKLASSTPYAKFYDNIVARSIQEQLGDPLAYARADWFVSKVSKPPFYHDFLDIPPTVAELEKKLLFNGVTAAENLEADPYEVMRAGISQGNSGVSAQN